MDTCKEHHHHDHQHGPGCGHLAINHAAHTDYLHDGHLHHIHGTHVDEHVLESVPRTPPNAPRITSVPGMIEAMSMVLLAGISRFRMAAMWIIWLTATCIIRMAITVIFMDCWRCSPSLAPDQLFDIPASR